MGQTDGQMQTVRFLAQCASCGDVRGEVALSGTERAIRVTCRCQDGQCPRCGRPAVRTISTHLYDEVMGKIRHTPASRIRCGSCGSLA